MKDKIKIAVTNDVTAFIAKLQTKEGMLEMKEFLCDAQFAVADHMAHSEDVSEYGIMPIVAIRQFMELCEELALSDILTKQT